MFTEPTTGEFMDVECPGTGAVIGTVCVSGAADVDAAVAAAKAAHPAWAGMTAKGRAAIMMKWHYLIDENIEELSELVIIENGKNKTEAVSRDTSASGGRSLTYCLRLRWATLQRATRRSNGRAPCPSCWQVGHWR